MPSNTEVLNSWKEVAMYLGRGVRTVQRWEQELGLPVRRPRGKSRSAVIAFRSELDQWLHRAPSELLTQGTAEKREPVSRMLGVKKSERAIRLHDNTRLLLGRAKLLRSRSSDLHEQLRTLQQKIERTVQLSRKANHPFFAPASTTPASTGNREALPANAAGRLNKQAIAS